MGIKWYEGMNENYAIIQLQSLGEPYVLMVVKHGLPYLYPSEDNVAFFKTIEDAQNEIKILMQ